MRGLLSRHRIVPSAFYLASVMLTLNWRWLAFGDSLPAQVHSLDAISRGVFGFIVLFGPIVAWATAWGLQNRRKWPRWTGVFPCFLIAVLGFPWFSVVGVVGIILLWTHPVAAEPGFLTGNEFWSPRRASGWQVFGSLVCWTVVFRFFYSRFPDYVGRQFPPEWLHFYMPLMLLAIAVNLVIHESGHALASNLVGFRLRAFAVGPFVLERKRNAFQLRLSLQTSALGGYIYSLPVNQHRFREKEAVVVGAGPVANFLTAAALFSLVRLLGDSLSPFSWMAAAESCVTAFAMGISNLLPLGRSDGTMLLHLLLKTTRGQELLNILLRDAGLIGSRDNLAERRETLRRLLESRAPDPVKVGAQYILLGQAEVAEHHMRDAESHLVAGLAKIPDDVEPSIRLLGWESLHTLRRVRLDRTGAEEAYRRALDVAQSVREKYDNPLARIGIFASIASLHSRAHAWKETLDETAAGLLYYACHGGGEHLQWSSSHGRLLRLRAHALLQTGSIDDGLDTAEEAVTAIRAQPAGTHGPWELAILADTLWDAGQDERAISLLTDAVGLLQERGGSRLADRFRLLLAKFMAQTGRVGEAASVLPPEPGDLELRGKYLDARAFVRRAAGELSEAAADLSAVAALREQNGSPDETQLVVTRARLASVLAEAGELDPAESLAKVALEKLSAVNHPDLSDACIALAVVAGRRGASPSDYVERAIRCWQLDEWSFPAMKVRQAEAAAKLLDSAGLTGFAAQCRAVIPGLRAGERAFARSAA